MRPGSERISIKEHNHLHPWSCGDVGDDGDDDDGGITNVQCFLPSIWVKNE